MSNVSGRAAACQTAATLVNSPMYVDHFVAAMEKGLLPKNADIFKHTVKVVENYIRTGAWPSSVEENSE